MLEKNQQEEEKPNPNEDQPTFFKIFQNLIIPISFIGITHLFSYFYRKRYRNTLKSRLKKNVIDVLHQHEVIKQSILPSLTAQALRSKQYHLKHNGLVIIQAIYSIESLAKYSTCIPSYIYATIPLQALIPLSNTPHNGKMETDHIIWREKICEIPGLYDLSTLAYNGQHDLTLEINFLYDNQFYTITYYEGDVISLPNLNQAKKIKRSYHIKNENDHYFHTQKSNTFFY